VFNEKNSPFYESNSASAVQQLANMTEEDADESNLKYTINGYIYCNLPGLNMTVGDRSAQCRCHVACLLLAIAGASFQGATQIGELCCLLMAA
jgi:hypothetical protein